MRIPKEIVTLEYLDFLFFFFKRIKAVTISQLVDKSFKSYYFTNNSHIIYNGSYSLELEQNKICSSDLIDIFNKKHDLKKFSNIFVNVARITEQKNQKNLIKAFTNKVDSVCLLIGPIDKSYFEEIDIKNLPNNIILIGPTTNVLKYLNQADFLILPSLYEGLPISILEAISLGLIPVCTAVGGVLEVIKHNINGIIIKSPSVSDISSAIKYCENLSEERKTYLSLNAKENFNLKFSINFCLNNYLKLFNE